MNAYVLMIGAIALLAIVGVWYTMLRKSPSAANPTPGGTPAGPESE